MLSGSSSVSARLLNAVRSTSSGLSAMKHGLSWQTASLLHLIGSEGKRIVKIANTK